jgi:hypothetical protein
MKTRPRPSARETFGQGVSANAGRKNLGGARPRADAPKRSESAGDDTATLRLRQPGTSFHVSTGRSEGLAIAAGRIVSGSIRPINPLSCPLA